jgi:hypothetical protein
MLIAYIIHENNAAFHKISMGRAKPRQSAVLQAPLVSYILFARRITHGAPGADIPQGGAEAARVQTRCGTAKRRTFA